MGGNRASDIPLLKGDQYGEVYFKQGAGQDVQAGLGPSLEHFDIGHRCIWNDVVPAHRLDFYMVFLVMAGEATHRFGVQEHQLRKNMLCFVGPGMISSWAMTSGDQGGYICSFSDDFFHTGLADKQVLSRFPFFRLECQPVVQLSEAQAQEYVSLFKLMETEYRKSTHDSPTFAGDQLRRAKQSTAHGERQINAVDSKVQNVYSRDVLRGYLHALMGKARADYTDAGLMEAEAGTGIRLLHAFTEQLNRDFEPIRTGKTLSIRKVAAYADLLGVSQNHLNDTIQALTGLSPGQHIRKRLIQQATMCLMHSDKTVSEIAYRLGYEDPSYFARFYKNQTGKTPSAYRKK